jgi:hypothetical protein
LAAVVLISSNVCSVSDTLTATAADLCGRSMLNNFGDAVLTSPCPRKVSGQSVAFQKAVVVATATNVGNGGSPTSLHQSVFGRTS